MTPFLALKTKDPSIALERIRGSARDYAYVVDRDNRLLGVVTAVAAEQAVQRGEKTPGGRARGLDKD